ncbi:ABC transporter permease [Aeromicrobium sp.]|uniref:ABC transporter permease n=1 Tax=Aeromicrobium sp. TaxID=1871063 RepID=UPI00199B2272|nr:ABC transporter permease [Aeromicrobium sp.]MBC7631325.1 ABC transporter permease [Aeromicrobium sp.]
MNHVVILILGLAAGAAYALIALGLVLTFRGSGVINFAHGAFAMFGAYTFIQIRDSGKLVFPFVPFSIQIGDDASLIVSILYTLLVGLLMGLLSYFLIFRPLRAAPMLANVVASVGLLLSLQATAVLQFGSNNTSTAPVFPTESLSVGSYVVPSDRFFLTGLAIVVAVVLTFIYRFTRFGLATRAAAGNERGAIILGYNPFRLAAVNWALASALACGAGIVLVPISGVDAITMTLLVVPALGAALIGRLTSFPITAIAGLLIGAAQSGILDVQTFDWYPEFAKTGASQGLPFLVIIAVLVISGRRLPARGFSSARLPISRAASPSARRITTVVGPIVLLILLFTLSSGLQLALLNTMVISIIMLSIVVLTGFVGQISLAQAALAGTAGFGLSRFADQLGIPFPLSPILAVLLATAVGVLVGLPALRVRGVQLAVVTLAGGIAVQEFLFKNSSFTGGLLGSKIPNPGLFGLDLGVRAPGEFPRPAFGVFLIIVLVLLCIGVTNLRLGITGLRFLSLRANEAAAASVGINVAATKLVAFGIASALAAIGGVMIGYLQTTLSFGSFDIFVGLTWLALAYMGGITSVSGALVGGVLAGGGILSTVLDNAFGFGRYVQIVAGIGLILTAVLNQDGISGGMSITRDQVRARLAKRRQPDASPAMAGRNVDVTP